MVQDRDLHGSPRGIEHLIPMTTMPVMNTKQLGIPIEVLLVPYKAFKKSTPADFARLGKARSHQVK